ncbi:MAG: sialidase family protein [Acidobacteriota bacterium]
MRVVLLVVVLAACGDNTRYRYDSLVEVSGASPYADSCNGAAQPGTSYPGLELEPSLAIDPGDPGHLVAAWQQDRWSNGGANGLGTAVSFDGGVTWRRSLPKFSHCAGGDYQRASDPWVSIAADGTPYAISISFDATTDRSAVLAASSRDGGATWDEPIALLADDDPDVFNDKESITADPHDAGRAYAVWDRLTGLSHPMDPVGTGPSMLARMTDGAWEPARAIYDPGTDAQTIGNVIDVLPDGTLVDVFLRILMSSAKNPDFAIAAIRSTDHGDTWSAPVVIAPAQGVEIAKNGVGIRTGEGLPQLAVDPDSGALYVAWQDSGFDNMHSAIAVARSLDGGVTWSQPIQANGDPDAFAFTPAIAAGNGGVGLFYYDTRLDDPSSPAFRVAAWLASSSDRGATWSDERLSSAFDLRPAQPGSSYFLGDYQGLVANGATFVPLFAIAFVENDRSDIFVRP